MSGRSARPWIDATVPELRSYFNPMLGFGGFMLCGSNKVVARFVAPVVLLALYPLLSTRFVIEVSPEDVTVRRSWRLPRRVRRKGKLIQWRNVDPMEYFDKRFIPEKPCMPMPGGELPSAPGAENAPAIVELLVVRNRHRLLTTLHSDVAEVITLACQDASLYVDAHHGVKHGGSGLSRLSF